MSSKEAWNKEVCAVGGGSKGKISKMGIVQAGMLSRKQNLIILSLH